MRLDVSVLAVATALGLGAVVRWGGEPGVTRVVAEWGPDDEAWFALGALAGEAGTPRPAVLDEGARPFDVAPARPEGLSPRLAGLLRGRLSAPPGPRRTEAALRARLAAARGWMASLEAFDRLPGRDVAATALRHATAVREASSDPVVDQNLIFHVAISFPLAEAAPWLREVRDGGDPADREDALVALAFAGDEDAVGAFEALARTPSEAPVRRLLDRVEEFEAFAASEDPGVREVLRSYRALEVLARAPYFGRTIVEARFHWSVPPDVPPATRRRLHAAWLARYPGHPGSDDVAWRIAQFHHEAGEPLEAARWYSRAATYPDQDVAVASLEWLVGLAELVLTRAEVEALLSDRTDGDRNRGLLRYLFVRRTAAEEGLAEGLAAAEDAARAEPSSVVGQAWRVRWAAPVPRGLDSGTVPLPSGDPLRLVERGHAPDPVPPDLVERRIPSGLHGWPTSGYEPGQSGPGRLDPWREGVLLDVGRIARQLRAWETLEALDRRAGRARGGERADLLYKEAAVWFHDPDVLFPAYGFHTANFQSVHRAFLWHGDEGPGFRRARATFEERAFSWLRALDVFARLEREAPDYVGMDRVHFSRALCWKRLASYRPYGGLRPAWGTTCREVENLRRAAEALEATIRHDPRGPLADDAARALAYWRRTRPDLFRE